MIKQKKMFPFVMLSALVLAVVAGALGGSESDALASGPARTVGSEEDTTATEVRSAPEDAEDESSGENESEETGGADVEGAGSPANSQRWDRYDNVCESFTVVEGDHLVKNRRGERVYPIRYRRNRYKRTRSDQTRTRELIRFVAKEMGADREGQYLLDMMAHHESSWMAESIHILNGDLDANQKAWERHSYSVYREQELVKQLKEASAQKSKFWKIKAKLADVRMYKHNPHWGVRLEYTHKVPERTHRGKTYAAQEWKDTRSVWAFGYGLFGMNAVLYTHVLAQDAPPWVLCADEGIVATVTAIWALREQQQTCEYLSRKNPEKYGTDGGSVRSVIHRWGSGRCGKGRPGKAWRRLMKGNSSRLAKLGVKFEWGTVPDFGSKFPKYEMVRKNGRWRYKKDAKGNRVKADPIAVLEHMHAEAEKAGLLRPEPLKRKKPDSEPVVVARR